MLCWGGHKFESTLPKAWDVEVIVPLASDIVNVATWTAVCKQGDIIRCDISCRFYFPVCHCMHKGPKMRFRC